VGRERCGDLKKPRRVLFAESLPKDAYGKVLRRRVRDDLAARS
jgi:acyl-coenzyme A synthetase/AMP-(fatty) acid ligase